MLGFIHAEEENPEYKINAADETEIPEVPFNEAMQFLKSKIPMTTIDWENEKKDYQSQLPKGANKEAQWKIVESKLRFRAFTVANIGCLDTIETMKQLLLGALEDGESYSDTWETLKNILQEDVEKIRPGYWENVFRTNTQSAYIAGKLQQYENSNVAAYQLMVIEDGRTSKICRHLLTASGYGMIISVDHPFWKKYGFPPYHFQCRTSIRAIWPSQVGKLGNMVENPTMKSLSKFKVQEGFGGNPLDKESWWRMTPDMVKRAAQYGLFNDIEEQAKANGLYNFGMHLVKGSDLFKHPDMDYFAEGALLARPNDDEIKFAKLLEENGNTWYFTPKEKKKQNVKNPDGIFNGHIADMKNMKSKSLHRLAQRIKDADEQKVYTACLNLTVKPNYTKKEAVDFIKNVVLANKYKDISHEEFTIIENVKEVCLVYEGELLYIKK